MSSILKLSIQGIRSFGQDDSNRQVIQFDPPLTLILGPNGSGKTTVIECLRYITTGDMPPNSRGGSFVHDPKVAHETSVKGQIKLKLKDMTNEELVVTRSLEAIQRPKKVELRTLDASIRRRTTTGEDVTLSRKCAQIDKEMAGSLGVSKAILNNVIFCHQEESNWPLSEGKALKQRFDEIFAATRYIKALDNIKKIRNDQMSNIRVYHTEVKHLNDVKDEAAKLKSELEVVKTRLTATRNKINEINEKLEPIDKSLQDFMTKETKINEIRREKTKQETVREQIIKQQNELRGNIQTIFQGTMEQLKEKLNDFEHEAKGKQIMLNKLRRDGDAANNECDLYRTKRSNLMEELGRLNAEHTQYRDTILKRNKMIIKFYDESNIYTNFISKDALSDSEVASALDEITSKIEEEKNQLKLSKEKHETLECDLQNHLDHIRDQKTELDHSCKINTEQMNNNRTKIASLTQELGQVDMLVSKQNDLEHDLAELDEKLENAESSGSIENLRKKINDEMREKNNFEAQLNKLNVEMSKLQKEHELRTTVDIMMKDKKTKEDAINKIQSRHSGTIIHLLGSLPEEKIHNHVDKYIRNLSQDISRKSSSMEKMKSKLSSLETTRKYISEKLREKEKDVEKYKNNIISVCGNEDFESSFVKLEDKIKELQDEKGSLVGSKYIFTNYIEKLKHRSPCCPLCHRGFAEEKQAQELIMDLERKMKMVPTQLESKEINIVEHQKKLNAMTELRPSLELIKRLTGSDIPNLKKELGECSGKISAEKKEISELEENIESSQIDLQTALSLQKDTAIWDQSYVEMKKLEDQLLNLTCQLSDTDMSRNIGQVSEEQESVNRKLTSVKQKIEQYQQDINDQMEYIQSERSKRNDIKSELLQITSKLQQRSSWEEQRKSLNSENVNLDKSIKDARMKLKDLEVQLKSLRKEKEKLSAEKECDLEAQRKKIDKLEKQIHEINNLSKVIDKYIRERKEEKLTSHQDKLNKIDEEITRKEKTFQELNSKMTSIHEELVSYQLKERELRDNLKLMEGELQIEDIEKKVAKLEQQLGSFEIVSLLSTKKKLLKEREELTTEQQLAYGRQGELQANVLQLTKKLEGGMYKDADKKHHNKLIELRTTELASADLDKYHKALDCAILEYHKTKMKEINKIIRELWMKTYAGHDIDYIEIMSDDDGNQGLEKRRIYNYKVVMVKGDISIDMRGRCSAGQKVLASLIIRLALAETFCLNCGILALDEPTTNLDRENIESLAQALVEIVQSRSQQRNFQLIVITHDEDFISLLGRSNTVEYFYCVNRDTAGLSRIKKCSIGALA